MVIDALVAPFQVLVRQRPVITTFVQREIRTRYVTSALGIGWAVVRPLLLLGLYTFVFSYVLKVRFGTDNPSDFAFAVFCGMVPWLAFADGITRATTAIPEHAPLVKRMRFPAEILPVHQVLVALALESIGQDRSCRREYADGSRLRALVGPSAGIGARALHAQDASRRIDRDRTGTVCLRHGH